jgi:hypothetical protein
MTMDEIFDATKDDTQSVFRFDMNGKVLCTNLNCEYVNPAYKQDYKTWKNIYDGSCLNCLDDLHNEMQIEYDYF